MRADVPLHGEGLSTVADFTVHNGQRVRFSMSHAPSHHLALIGTALVLDSVTTSL